MSFSPARTLFRALLRQACRLRREGLSLELRLPVLAEWGTYSHSTSGRDQYQLDALQKILPKLPAPPGSPPYSGALLARHISATFHANAAAPPASCAALVEQGFLALRTLLEQHHLARCSSSATTHGVLVEVTSSFSHLAYEDVDVLYLFSYRLRITNQRAAEIKVLGRRWEFLNIEGKVEQKVALASNSVVGQQPTIPPGQTFEYTSGCWLKTSEGSASGQLMVLAMPDPEDETNRLPIILADVAPFRLIMPGLPTG